MTKSILITGCSSGIGLSAAIILKQRGYRVFATARKDTDIEKLTSLGLESIKLDVNDDASIQSALDQVLQLTGGTLDALFNNAGFMLAGGVEDMTRDKMRAQFETNTFGAMELTRRVLPIMRKQGHGRIIQNSSILGIVAMPHYSAYNASKFALEGFSDTLRLELRGTNIHVSIICPGPIYSKLRENAYELYQQTLGKEQSEVYKEAYKKMEESYFKRDESEANITNEPNVVVKDVIHALESPRPCAHYYVGRAAKLLAFLRRILPDRALDSVIATIKK